MPLHRMILVLVALAGTVCLLPGCNRLENEPIRIGYVGGLTGRTASVGVSGRDGALLAVEQANRSGGIDGRPVELIIRDDRQDETVAVRVIKELIDADVPAIIGPMTSSMAVVMAPIVNRSQTLMVSPTVSTMQLGKQDDNFLRVYPQCMLMSSALAEYVIDEKKLLTFSIIYDVNNRSFTESWKECFSNRFTAQGGKVVASIGFTSGGDHRFSELIEQALKPSPAGLLILANSLDAALLAQQIPKLGKTVPIFTSEWSMTRDLLVAGGRSVEGVTLFHTFNEESDKASYLQFRDAYRKRFGSLPSFPAIHSYDAAQAVISELRRGARTGADLKKALLGREEIETLQSSLHFDKYGDVNRDVFLTLVKDGRFVVVRQYTPKEN